MLPTAWPVRSASTVAVDGPSSLSRPSSRRRSGCAMAASTRESVIWRIPASSILTRLLAQALLCNCSCVYSACVYACVTGYRPSSSHTRPRTLAWRLTADQLDDVLGQVVADLLAQILLGPA